MTTDTWDFCFVIFEETLILLVCISFACCFSSTVQGHSIARTSLWGMCWSTRLWRNSSVHFVHIWVVPRNL